MYDEVDIGAPSTLAPDVSPSQWTIPRDCLSEVREVYKQLFKMLEKKADNGLLEPLFGNLQSAYQFYDLKAGRIATDETISRAETMPKFTNYTEKFNGTLDHIFFNKNKLDVVQLLDTPE